MSAAMAPESTDEITENQGESLALQRGDEADTVLLKPSDWIRLESDHLCLPTNRT